MVDLTGGSSSGPIEHGFNNWIFIVAGVLVLSFVGFVFQKKFKNLGMSDSPAADVKRVDKVLESLRQKLQAQAAAEMGLENQDELPPEQLQLLMDSLTENLKHVNSPGISIHWSILLASFIILFSFVGIFGYRLVRSLNERERKKEEKKKLKELKKKK